VVVPLSPAAVEGSAREAAGRSFVRQGVAWREIGARGAPVRTIGRESAEGRAVLADHPDLEPLLETAPEVQLVWRGDLVALVAEREVGEELP
jgi:hypothetical protein